MDFFFPFIVSSAICFGWWGFWPECGDSECHCNDIYIQILMCTHLSKGERQNHLKLYSAIRWYVWILVIYMHITSDYWTAAHQTCAFFTNSFIALVTKYNILAELLKRNDFSSVRRLLLTKWHISRDKFKKRPKIIVHMAIAIFIIMNNYSINGHHHTEVFC